jgi:hypothetical protein
VVGADSGWHLWEEMKEKQPGNRTEKLEKLLKPELEPLLQEPGTFPWLAKKTY